LLLRPLLAGALRLNLRGLKKRLSDPRANPPGSDVRECEGVACAPREAEGSEAAESKFVRDRQRVAAAADERAVAAAS
jgi:hypothetical protein